MSYLSTYDRAIAAVGLTAVRSLMGVGLVIAERDELRSARAMNTALQAELAAYQFDGDRRLPTTTLPPRPIRDYTPAAAAVVSDSWFFGAFVGLCCGVAGTLVAVAAVRWFSR